ncbi:probable protein phosphatase 2C 55 [Gastrolobium bilobum]|uniref:probable protein phosphatase 2C 55 n=1 Tax=Gastrolobium bilobum TaxID=150636 RepID=UPI002AB2F05B|nr:probable protein phosphatase 2C 55 [Gastrolobium bilobum]
MMNVKKRQAEEPLVSLQFSEKKHRVGEEFESMKMVARGKANHGVADGVGGWARKGIGAGDYARELMKNVTVAIKEEAKDSVDPKRVLNHAFMNTKAKGSSIASIVYLKKNVLHGVNTLLEYQVLVEPGDVLVLGTDGVFDNKYPFEIESILKDMTEEGRLMDVQECAKVIASMAWRLSISKIGGPFADACKKVGVNHKGGKMDDITVLVAHIIV